MDDLLDYILMMNFFIILQSEITSYIEDVLEILDFVF